MVKNYQKQNLKR